MCSDMKLSTLIAFLETMDPEGVVIDGFGSPHSDRGDYSELAFSPLPTAKVSEMLAFAKGAVGATFTGWKGGHFTMSGDTPVYIGEFGDCGEPITPTHFKYWMLTSNQRAV